MAVQVKYGIDFGTTNSSIALLEQGGQGKKPTLFQVDDYHQPFQVIRSAVAYKDGTVYIGDEGLERVDGDEDNPILRVKLFLIHAKKDVPVSRIGGKDLLISDVMAEILRVLREKADFQKRKQIVPSGVVMGVPYGTTEAEKQVYLIALCKAGFYSSMTSAQEQTEFMEEPVSAAIFYGGQQFNKDKTALIFDFGGGTLDLAVVLLRAHVGNGETHQVLAKGGRHGAGERFTKILFQKVFFPAYRDEHCNGNDLAAAKMFQNLGCSSRYPDGIWDELSKTGLGWKFIHALDQAKASLSLDERVRFFFDAKPVDKEPVYFKPVTLSRDSFEQALIPELGEITTEIQLLLSSKRCREAGVTSKSLDQVVLVGGSSAIPCVQAALKQQFGDIITFDPGWYGNYPVNALTSIAQGLAIAGYKDQPLISDITSFDYGVFDGEGKIVTIIPKGTVIAETDQYDFTREGYLPEKLKNSPFKREIRQMDMSKDSFEIEVYEGQNKIMTLLFDKRRHSGSYFLFFRIDALRGILEVYVYDKIEGRWIDDLSLEDRSFRIRGRKPLRQ